MNFYLLLIHMNSIIQKLNPCMEIQTILEISDGIGKKWILTTINNLLPIFLPIGKSHIGAMMSISMKMQILQAFGMIFGVDQELQVNLRLLLSAGGIHGVVLKLKIRIIQNGGMM